MSKAHNALLERWERDNRYYLLSLQRDLFGQWLVTRTWGSVDREGGQSKQECVEDYQAGLKRIAHLGLLRTRRGYRKKTGRSTA